MNSGEGSIEFKSLLSAVRVQTNTHLFACFSLKVKPTETE